MAAEFDHSYQSKLRENIHLKGIQNSTAIRIYTVLLCSSYITRVQCFRPLFWQGSIHSFRQLIFGKASLFLTVFAEALILRHCYPLLVIYLPIGVERGRGSEASNISSLPALGPASSLHSAILIFFAIFWRAQYK